MLRAISLRVKPHLLLSIRLSAVTDIAMQKSVILQQNTDCLQHKVDLVNNNCYLFEGNRAPLCLGCNGDQEIADGPCFQVVFCSSCASCMTELCPVCNTIVKKLRVYRV